MPRPAMKHNKRQMLESYQALAITVKIMPSACRSCRRSSSKRSAQGLKLCSQVTWEQVKLSHVKTLRNPTRFGRSPPLKPPAAIEPHTSRFLDKMRKHHAAGDSRGVNSSAPICLVAAASPSLLLSPSHEALPSPLPSAWAKAGRVMDAQTS